MNTIKIKSIRTLTALWALPTAVFAANSAPAADSNAAAMNATGSLTVQAAGPYIEVGSYRIWVTTHLGRPDSILPDGSWVYENFRVKDTEIRGALIVTFNAKGHVSQLNLVSPAVLVALRAAPQNAPAGAQIAQNR